jgi:hypothetical protein
VILGVHLGRVLVMFGRVQRMPMRDLGMVRGLFVIAGLMMLCRLAMMLGGMIVMIRSMLMMFVNVVIAHRRLPAR